MESGKLPFSTLRYPVFGGRGHRKENVSPLTTITIMHLSPRETWRTQSFEGQQRRGSSCNQEANDYKSTMTL